MKSPTALLIPFALGIIFVSACGSMIPAPTPTQTPSPTLTATSTPTPLPDPATAIAQAFQRSRQAKSYRIAFSYDIDTGLIVLTGQILGERNGNDFHSITTASSLFGETRDEVLSVGFQAYLHGPNERYGAPESKWYRVPYSLLNSSSSTPNPLDVLSNDSSDALRLRAETFDNVNCDVYTRDKETTLKTLSKFSGTTSPLTADQIALVDVAEIKYWVCADSYLHQIELDVVAHSSTNSKQQQLTTFTFHFYDFDQDIAINAPSDAVDLPTPTPTRTFSLPQPTLPTATPTPNAAAAANAQAQLAATLKWRVVMSDTFNANTNGWPLDDSSRDFGPARAEISNGKYVWNINAKKGVVFNENPRGEPLGDFVMSVEARAVSDLGNHEYGLVFRQADNLTNYFFMVSEDKTFDFRLHNSNGWRTIIGDTNTNAIRPGQFNRVTVIAKGSHYTFFINDQYVAEADDVELKGGTVGIAFGVFDAESGTFEFRNFQVRAP